MTIIDYFFKESANMGSFEYSICKAWINASPRNRIKIENAFPEHFPVAQMYGVEDFRVIINRSEFNRIVTPHIVKMNQWGHLVDAVHLPWSEIRQRRRTPSFRGESVLFKKSDRNFGTFIDPETEKEVNCLCFPDYTWRDHILWYVTEEKLEDIED